MMRCAECTCEHGDEDCNWISTEPPRKLTPEERVEMEREAALLQAEFDALIAERRGKKPTFAERRKKSDGQ